MNMNMPQLREGQKVRIKQDCSGMGEGEIAILVRELVREVGIYRLFARHMDDMLHGGCSCVHNWELIEEDDELDMSGW